MNTTKFLQSKGLVAQGHSDMMISGDFGSVSIGALLTEYRNTSFPKGVFAIADERNRQIEIEKFDVMHDFENYGAGQLVGAAMCYAANAVNKLHNDNVLRAQISDSHDPELEWQDAWPWSADWDKREKHDQKRSLLSPEH